ncbi:hypothetical protein [Methanohalobium sp.]|uniref:hypothetical protein n=1 Tax=Methanohalobium sp. TaxID=2837493 RepID=UPI0025F3CB40|nr:hypothetical protein [Methanohalobium sp.]
MGWRDNLTEDRDFVAASTIGDGEWTDFRFQDEGEEIETEAGDAVRFPVEYVGSQQGSEPETMGNDALEDGEEYYLLTSSSRLLAALADAGESLSGVTCRIHADGEVNTFERSYDVEVQ